MKRAWIGVGLLACWLPVQGVAGEPPQVWGYGVQSCRDYIPVWKGWDEQDPQAEFDYLLYREWLAGLVTGLSLATGQDVLVGVDMQQALRRIKLHCDEHPEDDLFTAAMALVRLLSML